LQTEIVSAWGEDFDRDAEAAVIHVDLVEFQQCDDPERATVAVL
jgi:hypothetical protein